MYSITGKGIKVGIIDTGVDYMHPALGGCFGENCRVAYGYDFVGDEYIGENMPIPDNDPRDTCNGHGTHVAGIIGARDSTLQFTGIAPDGKNNEKISQVESKFNIIPISYFWCL